MTLDYTICAVDHCPRCGGAQWLRVERERENGRVSERYVLACWNGHRSYL